MKILIQEKKPIIVFLTETRCIEEIKDNEINIKGYNLIRCDSYKKTTGGVIIYLKKKITYNIISNYSEDDNWFLSIRIQKGFRRGDYGVIYHSPSSSNAQFLSLFTSWYETYFKEENFNLNIGDFNIDLSKQSTYSTKLKQIINFLGLKQIVKDFTRVTNTSETLIDLCLTNDWNIKAKVLSSYLIADHNTISLSGIEKSKMNEELYKDFICWKNYNKQDMNMHLFNFNWKLINTYDLEMKTYMFDNLVKECLEKLIKRKKIIVNNNNKWYSASLNQLRIEKDNSFKTFKFCAVISSEDQDQKNTLWKNYTVKRNKYAKLIKDTYCEFVQDQIETNKQNPKQLWRVLKTLLKQESSTPTVIDFQGEQSDNNIDISNKFNEYFIQSVNNLNASIPDEQSEILINHCVTEQFKFTSVTKTDIIRIIKSFNNNSGVNNINKQIILDSFDTIGDTLVEIINESLLNGEVPTSWKISTVIPIAKVNGSIKCEDFRPINMLPFCEKTLEYVVKEQLLLFINNNCILTDVQSGFRQYHSCESSLNYILSIWKNDVEANKKVVAVFLDLKRAFETIDRALLIAKLEKYGITGVELDWFRSYLSNRGQLTKFNNETSSTVVTSIGVPQGSVLGPILFILYLNDIVNCVSRVKMNLFADDSLVSVAAKTSEEGIQIMNSELKSLSQWLRFNKLKLNTSKTKYILINGRGESPLNEVVLENETIERVCSFKYLGVLIDENLNFKEYSKFIEKKMAKKVNLLARLSSKLTYSSKISIYKSTIAPHIDYCSSILFLGKQQEISCLQKIQNRALRVILKCNKRTKIVEMLTKLQWLSINQRILYNVMILIYKIKKGILPSYLQNQLVTNSDINPHRTRHRDDFRAKMYFSERYPKKKSCSIENRI